MAEFSGAGQKGGVDSALKARMDKSYLADLSPLMD